MDTSTWIAVMGLTITCFSTIVVGVVWGVRQEGRINGHEKLFAERKEQMDEKFDSFCDLAEERHREMLRRMDRIDQKLDKR